MATSQSKLVNGTRQYDSYTANGAVTHSTSLDSCLDLFFLAGASRRMAESDMIQTFERARLEDRDLAYKILFWARDCRGGAGEKRFFQVIGKYCSDTHAEEWDRMAIFIPEYGYWKDIFKIEMPNENNLNWLMHQFEESENSNLLAKWFPRKGKWFSAMHKYLKKTPKEFRKYLVEKTKVVETQMCNKEWSAIDYSKVPSVAMNMYRNSFDKNDGLRFNAFNQDVLDGKAKVNAGVLFPHMLYQAADRRENADAIQAQWQSLPNYMEGSKERILPVCDVSGSMTGLPMDVSVSLGLYISERNEGIFKDAFMTFSSIPEMVYIPKGFSVVDKLKYISRANWGMSTDLQATFRLILKTAVRNSLPEDEMPTKVLIISDMEFNQASYNNTNLDEVRTQYELNGYKMPEIIFWNVNGRVGNVPARTDEPGVGLVSGFSPAILTAILSGSGFTPLDLMMKAVGSERYEMIRFD
jgi:hypothetical protein